MAQIVVSGKPLRISKKEVKQATAFFCDYLLNRLSRTVSIKIEVSRTLFQETKCYGELWIADEQSQRTPREYEVKVDAGLSRRRMLRTLAHECVHIRQYARNELRDLPRCYRKKWLGKIYDEDMNYLEQPWERDALSREVELYSKWLDYRRKCSVRSTVKKI